MEPSAPGSVACLGSGVPRGAGASGMEIYLSGFYRGPQPSPGVGTARSLRLAFPEATLVGVDYSASSSRLHYPDVDLVRVLPRWSDIDRKAYAHQIDSRLASGAIWISGLDLETLWLSEAVQGRSLLLVPPRSALATLMRPSEALGGGGVVAVPPTLSADATPSDLHAFCRLHGWRVWLKSCFGGRSWRIRRWADLLDARRQIGTGWGGGHARLQAHVHGEEELVGLAAFQGRLIDACLLANRVVAGDGTTSAAAIGEVSPDLHAALQELMAALGWSGGAEVRIIRDLDGRRWLTGIKPRFPAWIHTATLAARNLPGLLVEAATGAPAVDPPDRGGSPQPSRPGSGNGGLRAGDVPPALTAAGGIEQRAPQPRMADESVDLLSLDLEEHMRADLTTPRRVFVWSSVSHRWAALDPSILPVASGRVALKIAYSVKTNPEDEVLALARSHAMAAEAISQLEVRRALAAGFGPGDIILNGPGKWWPERERAGSLRAVFCDSLLDLRRTTEWMRQGERVAEVVGVRLRPPQFTSRFGIPVVPWRAFRELVDQIQRIPGEVGFGVHFHMPPSTIGIGNWWSLFDSMLSWALTLEATAGKPVECLDLGGGWYPDDWDMLLRPRLPELVETAAGLLPQLRELILEPGRALVQSAMAVLTKVLEVRPLSRESAEVVVDAAIAEIPENRIYPHRILARHPGSGRWSVLRRGRSRVLGRSCMEHDILATDVELPAGLVSGDFLAIADAGAYDRSKSYVFGRG